MDDSSATRDYHSNSEAMDVEPISETVENVTEDGINKKCESPHRSVSTFLSLSLSLFDECLFLMEHLRC